MCGPLSPCRGTPSLRALQHSRRLGWDGADHSQRMILDCCQQGAPTARRPRGKRASELVNRHLDLETDLFFELADAPVIMLEAVTLGVLLGGLLVLGKRQGRTPARGTASTL